MDVALSLTRGAVSPAPAQPRTREPIVLPQDIRRRTCRRVHVLFSMLEKEITFSSTESPSPAPFARARGGTLRRFPIIVQYVDGLVAHTQLMPRTQRLRLAKAGPRPSPSRPRPLGMPLPSSCRSSSTWPRPSRSPRAPRAERNTEAGPSSPPQTARRHRVSPPLRPLQRTKTRSLKDLRVPEWLKDLRVPESLKGLRVPEWRKARRGDA